MWCSAGVPPAVLRRVEIRKIAGETPALRKTCAQQNADIICSGHGHAGGVSIKNKVKLEIRAETSGFRFREKGRYENENEFHSNGSSVGRTGRCTRVLVSSAIARPGQGA